MKWAYTIHGKTKFISLLLLIIIIILLNNIANRRTFSSLNEHIASIYKDRLMPATYIFQLTDHLYQKKLLQSEGAANNILNENYADHDKAIASIIRTYEKTYLTSAEKTQWVAFRQQLAAYDKMSIEQAGNKKLVDASFNKVLKTLNNLSDIQAKEGNDLFKKSSISISGTIIMSHLEVALLLILGIAALVILSVNDNPLTRMQRPGLN